MERKKKTTIGSRNEKIEGKQRGIKMTEETMMNNSKKRKKTTQIQKLKEGRKADRKGDE